MKKGRAGTMTYDCKRHGKTTLFAALNVLDGTVIAQNMQHHRHQEFIRFLNRIEREGPTDKCRPRHPRQLRRAQEGQGPRLARPPPAPDRPLHADLVLVAQCRRGLLRQTHAAQAQVWRLPIRRRPSGRHQPLYPRNTTAQTQNPSSGKPTPIISSPHETEGSKRWNQSTRMSAPRQARQRSGCSCRA